MKNRKRAILTVFVITICLVALTACSTSGTASASTSAATSAASSTASSSTSAQAQADSTGENTIYGNVTAIDGTSITLALGTLNASAPGNGQGGRPNGDTPPAGDAGAMPSGQASGEPPEMPSGDAGAMPSGQPSGDKGAAPSGGEMPSLLTLTGDEKTITVSDESMITAENGSSDQTGLAAIQVGSTLKITYADDGTTIQSIVIMNGMGGGGAPGGQNPDAKTPGASASAATAS